MIINQFGMSLESKFQFTNCAIIWFQWSWPCLSLTVVRMTFELMNVGAAKDNGEKCVYTNVTVDLFLVFHFALTELLSSILENVSPSISTFCAWKMTSSALQSATSIDHSAFKCNSSCWGWNWYCDCFGISKNAHDFGIFY